MSSAHDTIEKGEYCVIAKTAKLGVNVRLGSYCEIRENCKVGDNTSFGSRCTLAAGTKVGKNCKIKYGFVATDTANFDGLKAPCTIGDDVRIGANVTLMPGRKIGNGATIGACSQVRHDVPDGAVWFGNPAGPGGAIIEDEALRRDKSTVDQYGNRDDLGSSGLESTNLPKCCLSHFMADLDDCRNLHQL